MSLFGHGKLCNCASCAVVNAGPQMFAASWPAFDPIADGKMRNARIKDPARYGNSARENLAALFELDQEVGHEATDYQNPYLIVPTATLEYPAPYGTALDPQYALGHGLQNEADVAINIQATQNVIVKGA